MHKLVIAIEQPEDWAVFDETWPQFLHAAEQMPGLRREATSRVEVTLFGSNAYTLVHELFFDSSDAAQQAMISPSGRETGRLLQVLTRGRMTLYLAEHNEDELDNIRKHSTPAE